MEGRTFGAAPVDRYTGEIGPGGFSYRPTSSTALATNAPAPGASSNSVLVAAAITAPNTSMTSATGAGASSSNIDVGATIQHQQPPVIAAGAPTITVPSVSTTSATAAAAAAGASSSSNDASATTQRQPGGRVLLRQLRLRHLHRIRRPHYARSTPTTAANASRMNAAATSSVVPTGTSSSTSISSSSPPGATHDEATGGRHSIGKGHTVGEGNGGGGGTADSTSKDTAEEGKGESGSGGEATGGSLGGETIGKGTSGGGTSEDTVGEGNRGGGSGGWDDAGEVTSGNGTGVGKGNRAPLGGSGSQGIEQAPSPAGNSDNSRFSFGSNTSAPTSTAAASAAASSQAPPSGNNNNNSRFSGGSNTSAPTAAANSWSTFPGVKFSTVSSTGPASGRSSTGFGRSLGRDGVRGLFFPPDTATSGIGTTALAPAAAASGITFGGIALLAPSSGTIVPAPAPPASGGFTFAGAAPSAPSGAAVAVQVPAPAPAASGFTFQGAPTVISLNPPKAMERSAAEKPGLPKKLVALTAEHGHHGLGGVLPKAYQNRQGMEPIRAILEIDNDIVQNLKKIELGEQSNYFLTDGGQVHSLGEPGAMLGRRYTEENAALCLPVNTFDGVVRQDVTIVDIAVCGEALLLVGSDGLLYQASPFCSAGNRKNLMMPPRRFLENSCTLYLQISPPGTNDMDNGTATTGEFDGKEDKSNNEAVLEAACSAAMAAVTGGNTRNPRIIWRRLLNGTQFVEVDVDSSDDGKFNEIVATGSASNEMFLKALNDKLSAEGVSEKARAIAVQGKNVDADAKENLAARVEVRGFAERPFSVDFDQPARKVWCSEQFGIVLTADGKLYSFGKNELYQLGRSRDPPEGVSRARHLLTPNPIEFHGLLDDEHPIDCAVGDSHLIVLTNKGRAFVAGNNNFGQLGIGSTTNPLAEKMILSPLPAGKIGVQVAASSSTSHVLCADGTLFSAGQCTSGTLGRNVSGRKQYINQWKESSIPEGANVEEVHAKYGLMWAHSATEGDDGNSLYSYVCGNNDFAQTGLNSLPDSDCVKLLSCISQLQGLDLPVRTLSVSGGGHSSLLVVQTLDPNWYRCTGCDAQFQDKDGKCPACDRPKTDETPLVDYGWMGPPGGQGDAAGDDQASGQGDASNDEETDDNDGGLSSGGTDDDDQEEEEDESEDGAGLSSGETNDDDQEEEGEDESEDDGQAEGDDGQGEGQNNQGVNDDAQNGANEGAGNDRAGLAEGDEAQGEGQNNQGVIRVGMIVRRDGDDRRYRVRDPRGDRANDAWWLEVQDENGNWTFRHNWSPGESLEPQP